MRSDIRTFAVEHAIAAIGNDMHATRRALLATAIEFLSEHEPHDITIEMVLKKSGISHGSLYYHFKEFGELINMAQVSVFSSYVDRSIEMLSKAVKEAKSKQDVIESVKAVTRITQDASMVVVRQDRTRAIAQKPRQR